MKQFIRKIWSFFLFLIVIECFCFFYLFAFLNMLFKFDILSEKSLLVISLSGSMCVSLTISIIDLSQQAKSKWTLIGNWFYQHLDKIILFYLFSLIVFHSITPEINWEIDSLRSFVQLEWTILGLCITIFLVWTALIRQFFNNKALPKEYKNHLIGMQEHLRDRSKLYLNANMMFISLILLCTSTISVVLSTSVVYVLYNQVSIASQSLVITSFYICTNTLLSLLADIIKPLLEEKRQLNKIKISKMDVVKQRQICDEIENIDIMLSEIMKLDTISPEEKRKIIDESIVKLVGTKEELTERVTSILKQKTDTTK